jgi:hypothetical protein
MVEKNMLLEFSVKNFLSFKNEVTLSMYASAEVTEHEKYNVFSVGGQNVLRTAVIYGFHSKADNHAQLIFATHDTNLLQRKNLVKHLW